MTKKGNILWTMVWWFNLLNATNGQQHSWENNGDINKQNWRGYNSQLKKTCRRNLLICLWISGAATPNLTGVWSGGIWEDSVTDSYDFHLYLPATYNKNGVLLRLISQNQVGHPLVASTLLNNDVHLTAKCPTCSSSNKRLQGPLYWC